MFALRFPQIFGRFLVALLAMDGNSLSQESVCSIMFVGSLLGSWMMQYTMLHKMSQTAMNSSYVFGTLPLLVAIHVLRCEVRLRRGQAPRCSKSNPFIFEWLIMVNGYQCLIHAFFSLAFPNSVLSIIIGS